MIQNNRASLIESKEGYSSKVLKFMPSVEFSKWNARTRRAFQKIKKDEFSDVDHEYIDIDEVLGLYMEEFSFYKVTL